MRYDVSNNDDLSKLYRFALIDYNIKFVKETI